MKNCPCCGQQNPEENQFCTRCRADFSQTPPMNSVQQVYMPPVPAAKKKTKWWAILGLLSGVSTSGSGILVMIKQPYVYIPSYSYGADFYTNTSEQLQDIGRYLENISDILSTGLGCLLIALGMFMIWHFVGKLMDK